MIDETLCPDGFVCDEVHQAEGALSVRLSISVPDAVVMLRARAAFEGVELIDAALDVLRHN